MYKGPRNSSPSRKLVFCRTSDTADSRSTTTLRYSSFGAVGDVADSTSIIFLHPPDTNAASSASSFSPSWKAAASPAERQRTSHRQVRDGRPDLQLREEGLRRLEPQPSSPARGPNRPRHSRLGREPHLVHPPTFGVSAPFNDTNMPALDCWAAASGLANADSAPAQAARPRKSRRVNTPHIGPLLLVAVSYRLSALSY